MAKEAVAAFYAFLEKTPEVKKEAMSLQDRFEEQEDRIDELAQGAGAAIAQDVRREKEREIKGGENLCAIAFPFCAIFCTLYAFILQR